MTTDPIDSFDPALVRCCTVLPRPEAGDEDGAGEGEGESGLIVPATLLGVHDGKRWWPGTELRVRFLNGTRRQKDFLLACAAKWSEHANIRFKEVSRGDAEIRASFTPGIGSWSYMGPDSLLVPQDLPTLNIGWDPDPATCLHELGHALGCVHEHQLPDAGIPWNVPAVYRYYATTQGWGRELVDSNVFGAYGARELANGSRFDPRSIMLYPLAAELLTDPSRATPWNTSLSPGDKAFIASIYPFGGRPPGRRASA